MRVTVWQPNSAGVAAKSGHFIGQFSWVTGNLIGRKGLCLEKYYNVIYEDRIDLEKNVYLDSRTSAGSAACRQLSMQLELSTPSSGGAIVHASKNI